MQGYPRISAIRSNSRATRWPDSEVSTTEAKHSRLKSSITFRMRNRRPPGERVGHKVERPALVRPLWDRHRRPCPERPFAAASLAHGQPLFPVDPVELLPVHGPALALQQDVQASIAEPSVLTGQLSQPSSQRLVLAHLRLAPIHTRIEPGQGASPPLGIALLFYSPVHGTSPRTGLQKFFPSIFLSLAFSASSAFSRRASDTSMPPYFDRQL